MSRTAKRVEHGMEGDSNSTTIGREMSDFRSQFSDLLEGSTRIKVNPFSFLPLRKFREVIRSGVMRLVHLFHDTENDTIPLCGTDPGSDMAIVIKLDEHLMYYVTDHFNGKGREDDDV